MKFTFHIEVPEEEVRQLIVASIQQGMGTKLETEKTLSREEYAELISSTPDTVTKMCKANKLKHKMVGRRYRIYVNQNN